MTNTNLTLSRRAVTGMLFTLPAIAAPAVASAALRHSTTGPSAEFTAAIAAHKKAVATAGDWFEGVYAPAFKDYQAAVDAIPHCTTENGFQVGLSSQPTHMSTNNSGDVVVAKIFSKLPANQRYVDDQDRACEELLGKLEWREAEKQKLIQFYNIDALDQEDDRLNDISYRALQSVETFQVRTMADLIAKIEFMEETEGQIEPAELLRDLHRITAET